MPVSSIRSTLGATTARVAVHVGLVAALSAAALASDPGTLPATTAFERFRDLAGEWKGTNSKGEIVRFTYELHADGTAVLERFRVGNHDMLTVYHLDGSDLMLTHYCAQGNQPRMKAVDFSGDEWASSSSTSPD